MVPEIGRAIEAYTSRHPGEKPWMTQIEGLILLRADHEDQPKHIISRPALCVVAQGAKWTSFGDKRHIYRAGQALLINIETPSVGRITEASPEAPFLGAVIELDPAILREVYDGMPDPPVSQVEAGRGAFVLEAMDPQVEDCVLRLLRLLDHPRAIPLIAPMIRRELAYWLLSGPHGAMLAELTLGRERVAPIMRTIHRLREEFSAPFRMSDLAAEVHLSPSAFHRQFKAVTSMTPLQYQKQLRLLEARRMILSEGAKVESAAFATGYESPSQFSREYARMFGRPPKRDASITKALPEWA